jgi:hypothetical protein
MFDSLIEWKMKMKMLLRNVKSYEKVKKKRKKTLKKRK